VANPPAPEEGASSTHQAAAGELLPLAGWQALGIGTQLHPNSVASIPRRADERPGRRGERNLRLYSFEEIQEALAREQPSSDSFEQEGDEQ